MWVNRLLMGIILVVFIYSAIGLQDYYVANSLVETIKFSQNYVDRYYDVNLDEKDWHEVGTHYIDGLAGIFRIRLKGMPEDKTLFLKVGGCLEEAYFDGNKIFEKKCGVVQNLGLPDADPDTSHVLAIKTSSGASSPLQYPVLVVGDYAMPWVLIAGMISSALAFLYTLCNECQLHDTKVKVIGFVKKKNRHFLVLLLFFLLLAHFALSDRYTSHLRLGDVTLVDEIDSGDYISEAIHGYWINGRHSISELKLDSPDESRVLDEAGWIYSGTEFFRIDAIAGRDLTIVKLIDAKMGNQKVRAYVNNEYVGELCDQIGGRQTQYAVWDYLTLKIPKEHVQAGRVDVMLESAQSSINAYHYWFYSDTGILEKTWRWTCKAAYYTVIVFLLVVVVKRLYRTRWKSILLFASSLAILASFAYYVYGAIPHVGDEVAQLFHAKVFAMGYIYVQPPPMPQFHGLFGIWIVDSGKWFSILDPGHTIMLAIGVLAGYPWLVGPVLGALTVVIAYYIGREAYNERIGLYAALLGMISPFFVVLSASMMRHSSSMFFTCLFILTYILAEKKNKTSLYILSAAFSCMAFLSRSYSTIWVALPFIVYHVYRTARDKALIVPTVLMVLVALLFSTVVLGYNYLITGNPLESPAMYVVGSNVPGFGVDKGYLSPYWTEGHTISKGIANTVVNLKELNNKLLGWPILPLGIVFFIFMKKNRWDYIFAASVACLIIGHVFFWNSGDVFLPRFYYESLFMMILLISRGIYEIEGERGVLFAAVLLLSVASSYLLLGSQLYDYNSYFVSPIPLKVMDSSGIKNAVVFTKGAAHLPYSVFSRNSPTLDTDIVYAQYVSEPENKKFISLYPKKDCYVLELNGGFYRLYNCSM